MGLTNPDVILFDLNGNPYGVSGSMQLPLGAIGQLVAGIDNSVSGTTPVTYLSMSNGAVVVTGTVNSQVTFPSEIGVIVGNWPAVVGVSGSVNVYTSGLQGVSGTVGAVVQNWPATIGVSGSVNVYTSGPQAVSGTVSVTQPVEVWQQGIVGVSGSQLTGSTFNGFPVVAGGVYSNSIGERVTALQTDASGVLFVAISGSVNATFPSSLGVVVENWPAAVGVSGSVNVYTSGLQGVSGTVGSVIQNWPATVGVSGSVNVYTSGLQGVSGTVSIGGYGVGVTGSVITTPIPAPIAAVTSANASTSNATLLAANPARLGATFFNEGSSTLFLKLGTGATQASYSVQLGAKGYYELPFSYTGEVDGVFSTNTGAVRITELT